MRNRILMLSINIFPHILIDFNANKNNFTVEAGTHELWSGPQVSTTDIVTNLNHASPDTMQWEEQSTPSGTRPPGAYLWNLILQKRQTNPN